MTPYFQNEWATLYCADFRLGVYHAGLQFDACLADPPYGETSLCWDNWPNGWPDAARMFLKPTGSLWCFGSFKMFLERWAQFAGWKLSHEIVWEKHNGSSFHADRFKRVHELAAHFYPDTSTWGDVFKRPVFTHDAIKRTVRRKRRPPHTGNIGASAYTSEDGGPRMMRSVIPVRSCHGYAENETQKPTGILRPLIEYACPPGGVLLVPFSGAGSEMVAAMELGIRSVGFELREEQCEIAARRLSQGVLSYSPRPEPQRRPETAPAPK